MALAITKRQIDRTAFNAVHNPPDPRDNVKASKSMSLEKNKMAKELAPFLMYLYKKHMKAKIMEGTDLEMLKLINKAMRMMPGSPKQKKVIQQLNKLRTKNGLDPLKEDIKIPISVGDTILGGKFKNKRIVVKSIGKNEKGDITINGKPLLKYRLLDEDSPASSHPLGKKEVTQGVKVIEMLDVIAHWMFGPDYHKLTTKQKKEVHKEAIRGKIIKKTPFKESINEIPMGDLQKIDQFADKKLNPVDVVLTDKHFFDRLNDPRNGKEISQAELIGFFKRLSKKKKEFVDFLNKYNSVVAVDDRTNINIPFMKQANKAIAKTVMRKKDFKTPDKKLDI